MPRSQPPSRKELLSRCLGLPILTFAFYTKARREGRFLRIELGEGAYDAYARKTAMLVPFEGRPPN
jgi:protein-S-isoprenylcysteine O-methyltransferase Ste14